MDVVKLGSVVTIYDFEMEEEISYKIVKTTEKDIHNDYEISRDCPLAKALLGKFTGVQVVTMRDNKYKVKILRVDNTHVNTDEKNKTVTKIRQIIKRVEQERKIEAKKKQKIKNLSGYYLSHPFQGGGCSGK